MAILHLVVLSILENEWWSKPTRNSNERHTLACCRWPCFGRRVGLDDPQRSLPNPTILWFCDSVLGCFWAKYWTTQHYDVWNRSGCSAGSHVREKCICPPWHHAAPCSRCPPAPHACSCQKTLGPCGGFLGDIFGYGWWFSCTLVAHQQFRDTQVNCGDRCVYSGAKWD